MRQLRNAPLQYWKEHLWQLPLIKVHPTLIAHHRDMLLGELCGGYKHRKLKPRSPSTVWQYLQCLSRIFTIAKRELHIVDTNPVSDVVRPSLPKGRTRFLSDDEITDLLAACRASENEDLHERLAEQQHLQETCAALEVEAGIAKLMERAREGHLIPLQDASSEEYFAFEYDYFRGKARDAYFSIQDISLRKKLICAQRNLESSRQRSYDSDVAAASHAVAQAAAKMRRQPWTKPAIVASFAVAVGYWAFGIVGALAGVVTGFFLGQAILSSAKNKAQAEHDRATHELDEALKEKAQFALWPNCFSALEESTGERERQHDQDSAWANVLQAGQGS